MEKENLHKYHWEERLNAFKLGIKMGEKTMTPTRAMTTISLFLFGTAFGCFLFYLSNKDAIRHYNNCQEGELQSKLAEIKDNIDLNTIHLCNDTTEVTAKEYTKTEIVTK